MTRLNAGRVSETAVADNVNVSGLRLSVVAANTSQWDRPGGTGRKPVRRHRRRYPHRPGPATAGVGRPWAVDFTPSYRQRHPREKRFANYTTVAPKTWFTCNNIRCHGIAELGPPTRERVNGCRDANGATDPGEAAPHRNPRRPTGPAGAQPTISWSRTSAEPTSAHRCPARDRITRVRVRAGVREPARTHRCRSPLRRIADWRRPATKQRGRARESSRLHCRMRHTRPHARTTG